MKKSSVYLWILAFPLIILFLSIIPANAQMSGNKTVEANQTNLSDSFSNEVDSSFTANLFSLYRQGTRSLVSALARQNDGKILVAGYFNYANGFAVNSLVRLNQDGSVDRSFNSPYFTFIQKILPLNNGKILLIGSFSTTINGNSYRNIIRLNEDGSVDRNFVTEVSSSNQIYDVVVQPDGKIIILGSSLSVNNLSANSVARLNKDGSLDTSFQTSSLTDGLAFSVALQPDGKILIGGSFTKVNNVAKPKLARLNTDGSVDMDFNSVAGNPSSAGPNNTVTEIIVQPNNIILIGGAFTGYNGVPRSSGLAKLEPDGTLVGSFNPPRRSNNTNGAKLLLQPDGKILAGFPELLSPTSTGTTLFRYNSDGSLDETFNSNITASVSAFVLGDNNKIIIGGRLVNTDSTPKTPIRQLNSDGSEDESFNVTLNFPGAATVIATQPDGKILVSGNFDFVNQTAKRGFARLNPDGTVDETFKPTGNFSNSSGNSNILAITLAPDGKILIGASSVVKRLNADGSLDTEFNPNTAGVSGFISNILFQEHQEQNKIILTGVFNSYDGRTSPGIVRLTETGGFDATFRNPFVQLGTLVNASAIQLDSKIIVAGKLTLPNGNQQIGIARLHLNGELDESFNALLPTLSVRAIAIQPDGKILIGGGFSQVNGISFNNLARLNSDGSVDLSFNLRGGANGLVNAILLQPDGKIWIGGDFTFVNAARRRNLARLNPDGSVDNINISAGTEQNESVLALARQANGNLLVGGSFTKFGGFEKIGLARIRTSSNNSAPLFDFNGDGKTDFAVFRAANGEWKIENSGGNTNGRLFGLPTDRITPADYDGDGKTDIAVFRPSNGIWYILKSSTNQVDFRQFGTNGDIPLAADFDGDGKDDLAVFRPSNGTWYIQRTTLGFTAVQFGANGDVPVIGDFDSDCQADIAVFRPSSGVWYVLKSTGGFSAVQFGVTEDIPVAGDYDGDGKTDFAVFRPSNGTWYVLATTKGFFAVQFGIGTDRPVPGDYDGDGKTDIAVFRSGVWYVMSSSDSSVKTKAFGAGGDQPIPSAYLR